MRTTQLLALFRKDLRVTLSDRRAVIVNFLLPVLIASFFGFVLGGRSGRAEVRGVPVRVIDYDRSALTSAIIAAMAGDKALNVEPSSPGEAERAVRAGKAVAAVVFPPGFGAAVVRGLSEPQARPDIKFVSDPSKSFELNIVRGAMTGHVMEALGRQLYDPAKPLAVPVLPFGMPEGASAAPAPGQLPDAPPPPPAEGTVFSNAAGEEIPYNGFAHVFAGMGVQFMLFMALETGISILVQRRQGIWRRLRSAPLARWQLLGASSLSGAFVSLLVLLFCFGFGRAAFGIRVEGSFAGFLLLCAASSVMASSFGLLVAAFGRTPEATRGLAIFCTLLLVMLGGGWLPLYFFPGWLQGATLALPTRWAIDGLEAVTWRGLGFGAALGPAAALLGFAALFLLAAVLRFSWEED